MFLYILEECPEKWGFFFLKSVRHYEVKFARMAKTATKRFSNRFTLKLDQILN